MLYTDVIAEPLFTAHRYYLKATTDPSFSNFLKLF